MDPLNASMTGYRVNEYLLVLAPHEELWKRIQKQREAFAEQFGTTVTRHSRPHITLVRFSTWEMMEERIGQRLGVIAMGMAPFKVELKDYDSYPSHTIFINVTSKLPIQNLVKQLKQVQRLMKMNTENKPHFIDEPHLDIGRRLKPWQYEKGWLEYAHRQFTGRFIADSMLFLKRPEGSKTVFQILRRFEFQNLPVTTQQGSLFA